LSSVANFLLLSLAKQIQRRFAQRCVVRTATQKKISRTEIFAHMQTNLRIPAKMSGSGSCSEQDNRASGFAWVAREPQLIFGAGWRASSQRSIDYHNLARLRHRKKLA
jgi:hypothetical protein